MNYIITENAIEISKELSRLSTPDALEGSLFGTIQHPNGDTAMEFNLDEDVLIHPNFDVTRLVEITSYTPEQKEALTAYFNSIKIEQIGEQPEDGFYLGRFPFKNIRIFR